MTRDLEYIDTHCHIHFEDFDVDRQEMSDRMSNSNVGAIAIGTDLNTSEQVVKLASEQEDIWACIGIHPNTHETFDAINTRVNSGEIDMSKVVAVGECGLDYFRSDGTDESEVARQKDLFKSQIVFAVERQLPLMLHIRSSNDEDGQSTDDAHNDVLDILGKAKEKYGDTLKIHCHFTTFGVELGKRFMELNATFGIPGVVTYKSAQGLQELVQWLPLERMVSETDAPYAAPVPHRGKRNEPFFVIDVVNTIADLRGEEREVVRKQLLQNAQRVFSLSIAMVE